MFSLNNPIIGEHFLKHPGPDGVDYIRHGENLYQYDAGDEVHTQGQAWQGFAWKLRKALMASLGDEAGATLAESLILPTMFAKAADIPSAIYQVLLADVDKNGKAAHEDLIRATAKIHGIVLPALPGKAEAVNALVGAAVKSFFGPALEGVETVLKADNPDQSATLTVLRLSAAPFQSAEARSQIQSVLAYLPSHLRGAKAEAFFERRTPSGVEFRLTLAGPGRSVDYVVEQLRRLSAKPAARPAQPPAA
jgi:hypothetical protein